MSKTWLLVLLLLTTPMAVGAQSYAIEGADRYFRIEWEASQGRRGPGAASYRLRVLSFDPIGRGV